MHRSARQLSLLARSRARPCTCKAPTRPLTSLLPPALLPTRLPAFSRPYASAPSPSSEEQQVKLAAQNVLQRAQEAAKDGSIEAAKREKELEPLKRALAEVQEAEELLLTLNELASSEPDPDLRSLALDDLEPASAALSASLSSLRSVLLPSSPEASLSALLEFKPGVGGSEATYFTAELVRMYQKLAARKGWKANIVESVGVEGLGSGQAFKEALVEVTGEGAFGYLRREAGVHRVQRVPATEAKGRVHTSTVAVLVLPAESGNQEIEDSDLYDLKDVKIETMRSRGAGGQHVNRTESAIRLTHLPTGVTVSMQDSRSQHELQPRSATEHLLRSVRVFSTVLARALLTLSGAVYERSDAEVVGAADIYFKAKARLSSSEISTATFERERKRAEGALTESERKIRRLANKCHLEYDGVSDLATIGGCFASLFFTRPTANEAPFIVLVFKGTGIGNFAEFVTDMSFSRVPASSFLGPGSGTAHKGFFTSLFKSDARATGGDGYGSVVSAMKHAAACIKEERGNSDESIPLWITGHSLGSALALLAFTRLL